MTKIKYVARKFSSASLSMLDAATTIIEDFNAQGYVLTLRQLYYQFVQSDAFPDDRCWRWSGRKWVRDPSGTKNAEPNYKWLGSLINDGRLAGLIDWESIEDRTRGVESPSTWSDPQSILAAAVRSYREDKWADQPCRIELWVEKEALAGVFARVCEELEIPHLSCRGYTSQSEMWRAASRLIEYEEAGQETHILHFGDHDPSGIDMTRDIIDRLEIFGSSAKVHRLALNMDQIEASNPPPNPAKMTDARARKYVERFGDESWELDALNPATLAGIAREAVHDLRDARAWKRSVAKQEANRARLDRVL